MNICANLSLHFQIALYFPSFTFDAFPMLFMGGFSIIGGSLVLLLPETLGQPLVESVEDVDEMAKDTKSFFSWWSSEQVQRHLEKRQAKMRGEGRKEE